MSRINPDLKPIDDFDFEAAMAETDPEMAARRAEVTKIVDRLVGNVRRLIGADEWAMDRLKRSLERTTHTH